MKNLRILIACYSVFLFLACSSYKPLTYYTNKVLGDKIHANVKISLQDPKTSIVLQDAINRAVIERFKSKLVAKKEANTWLDIDIKSVEFKPIEYDKNGFVTLYKTQIQMFIKTIFEDKSNKDFTIIGEYDFPIQANSIITDNERFDAINYASLDALDEYIAFISMQGVRHGNDK